MQRAKNVLQKNVTPVINALFFGRQIPSRDVKQGLEEKMLQLFFGETSFQEGDFHLLSVLRSGGPGREIARDPET